MVNALTLLREFDSLLPEWERPEHTEGREGYYHATELNGTAGEATISYIIRDFDDQRFEERQQTMRDVVAFLNNKYGAGTLEIELHEQYRNMGNHFKDREFLITNALEANREVGVEHLSWRCVAALMALVLLSVAFHAPTLLPVGITLIQFGNLCRLPVWRRPSIFSNTW